MVGKKTYLYTYIIYVCMCLYSLFHSHSILPCSDCISLTHIYLHTSGTYTWQFIFAHWSFLYVTLRTVCVCVCSSRICRTRAPILWVLLNITWNRFQWTCFLFDFLHNGARNSSVQHFLHRPHAYTIQFLTEYVRTVIMIMYLFNLFFIRNIEYLTWKTFLLCYITSYKMYDTFYIIIF